MSRGGVASRRCEVLLDVLAAFRDMYDTYGGDGWGLSRDGEAAPLHKVFNSHMSRGGVASRRCEVLLDILAAFRDMYDTYGGDGWGLSRDGEAAASAQSVQSAHVPRWTGVRSFSTSSPHFETCTIPMEGMDGVHHAMARLQLCTKFSPLHMSHRWSGIQAWGGPSRHPRRISRHVDDTYGGDGWGLSRDGEAAPLHKVFTCTCPEVEWHPGVVRSFSTSSPHFETCTIPMEGMDGVYHAMARLHLCTKCSIRTCPGGGVASRRCEVLLDVLAAFRDMYDTYGGDGWGLSRDGEAAPLHKVFNLHMSRGGVASRRCEVLLDVLAAFRDMRCEVLLDVLAAFRDMYDTYGGDGWGLSRDGEALLHKVFNLHMSRGGVASRRCEVLLDILAAFRDMYDTYGRDGWGLSRDGEAAALHKVFNLHMSRGGVASRRCEVLLDILAAFRDMYDTYGGDG
ncbi:hypothetical protein PSENEW3_00005000, partial [Picochlorum sp. SENEW3]